MSEIQIIQKRIKKWLNTEQGKKYKKASPNELLFALEQNKILTPQEIETLQKGSLFTFGGKVSMSEALPLEGWIIERENKRTANNKKVSDEADKKLLQRLDKVKTELDSKVKENRFLRSAWHWAKNTIGFGANSKKVEQALENERAKISQISKPEVFQELTGVNYTKENFEKFLNGEIKLKSEQALEAYKQGQDGVVDFAADMASGIGAMFIYSAAIAAAPFTGGLSLAVGFGVAATSGAVIKTGFKAGAAAISGKKYTSKDLKSDLITGGVSGALGPLTGGMGGAVGKSVATRLGIQAVKDGVTSVATNTAKQGVKQGVKQWIKTAFVNPSGYKYTGGSLLKRATAFGAEAVTDGTLGGALDGGFRAGYENDWDVGAILNGTISGGAGGAVMSPAIGGGMKLTGKAGHSLGAKIKNFFGWGKSKPNIFYRIKNNFGIGIKTHEPVKISDIKTPTKKAIYSEPLPQNSPIYKDIHKLSEYLAKKFDAQAANINANEIDTMIKTLSSKYNVPEETILSIMSKLTQFGSYNQLCKLGKKLQDMGIQSFYTDSYTQRKIFENRTELEIDLSDKTSFLGVSTNVSLNYICCKKHHFNLASATQKQALILDDASLKYLENLKQSKSPELDAILQNINEGNLLLINLDGTGLKIDDNHFSYTALDGGINLLSLTEAALQQTNEKTKNIDITLNGSYKTRVQNVFGSDIANKIENINIEPTEITSQTISEQIRQKTPTAKDIELSINEIINDKLGANCSPTDRATAIQVLGKYYDNFAEIYSNESMAELLKKRHLQIEQIVKQLGKSMDDVVYVAPHLGKSTGLMAQMYAKVNDIPMEDFIVFNPCNALTTKIKRQNIPDGKVVVFVDDVIGSGISALNMINYDKFTQLHPNSNIIFSSLSVAEAGKVNIESTITSKKRNGKDFLLQDKEHQFQFFDSRYNASDLKPNTIYEVNKNIIDKLPEYANVPGYIPYKTLDELSGILADKDIQAINSGKTVKKSNGRIPSCFTEIKEINMFIKLNNDYFGFKDNGLCIGFAHMVPDNVTIMAVPLFLHMYNNTTIEGPLNKAIHNPIKECKIIQKIAEQKQN